MKMGKPHRVFLSRQALELLRQVKAESLSRISALPIKASMSLAWRDVS